MEIDIIEFFENKRGQTITLDDAHAEFVSMYGPVSKKDFAVRSSYARRVKRVQRNKIRYLEVS